MRYDSKIVLMVTAAMESGDVATACKVEKSGDKRDSMISLPSGRSRVMVAKGSNPQLLRTILEMS